MRQMVEKCARRGHWLFHLSLASSIVPSSKLQIVSEQLKVYGLQWKTERCDGCWRRQAWLTSWSLAWLQLSCVTFLASFRPFVLMDASRERSSHRSVRLIVLVSRYSAAKNDSTIKQISAHSPPLLSSSFSTSKRQVLSPCPSPLWPLSFCWLRYFFWWRLPVGPPQLLVIWEANQTALSSDPHHYSVAVQKASKQADQTYPWERLHQRSLLGPYDR